MKLERVEKYDPNGSQTCSIHVNEVSCSETGVRHVMIQQESNGDVGCVIACEKHFLRMQGDALAFHPLTEACVSPGAFWTEERCTA